MRNLTRRNVLLRTAAAASCVAVPAIPALATKGDAAIEAAAAAYWEASERSRALPSDPTDAEYDALYDAKMEPYDAAMKIPATTMRGLGIKAQMYRFEMFPLVSSYMVDSDLGALLSDIERLSGVPRVRGEG